MRRFNFTELLSKLKESILKEDFRAFDVSLWLMDFYITLGQGFIIEYEGGEELIKDERGFKRLLNKLAREAKKDPAIKQKIKEIENL